MDNQAELRKLAEVGDVAAQFQLNLQADTGNETTAGSKAIRLRPIERRIKKAMQRERRLVDPGLVALFRQLVMGKAPWPLYLWGPSGSGKTMAALCLCDFAATAVYQTVENLCDAIMADDGQPLWERVARRDLAVLDELGERLKATDLAYAGIKRFMDIREEHQRRVAIYVSNLTPVELQKHFDDRIGSRALCGSRFELKADDRRFTG